MFSVVFFFPSSFLGVRRPFRGCSAFFGWWSLAAASVISLLPLSEGRFHHRLAVVIVIFSPVFYRRLGGFYRRLGVFYRHKVWFFLAYLGFFS